MLFIIFIQGHYLQPPNIKKNENPLIQIAKKKPSSSIMLLPLLSSFLLLYLLIQISLLPNECNAMKSADGPDKKEVHQNEPIGLAQAMDSVAHHGSKYKLLQRKFLTRNMSMPVARLMEAEKGVNQSPSSSLASKHKLSKGSLTVSRSMPIPRKSHPDLFDVAEGDEAADQISNAEIQTSHELEVKNQVKNKMNKKMQRNITFNTWLDEDKEDIVESGTVPKEKEHIMAKESFTRGKGTSTNPETSLNDDKGHHKIYAPKPVRLNSIPQAVRNILQLGDDDEHSK